MTSTPTIDWKSGEEITSSEQHKVGVPTLITVVLDRSGSMENIKRDMEGGFDAFVRDQRAIDGVCKVTLAQFDNVLDTVYKLRDIKDVPHLDLVPRNATALYDALGKTVSHMRSDIDAMPRDNRPEKVIVVVITDGMENASREWQRGAIRDLILREQERGTEFVFFGANQDALLSGTSMGFQGSSSVGYAATAQGTYGATRSFSNAVSSSRLGQGTTDSYLVANAETVAAASAGDATAAKALDDQAADMTGLHTEDDEGREDTLDGK